MAIGAAIVAAELRHQQRADDGRQVIAALARDLGVSDSNVYTIVAVARVFTPDALPMPMRWSHLVKLSSVASDDARQFSIDQILRHQWSVRYLEQPIAAQRYERATSGGQLVPLAPGLPVRAQDVLRASYPFAIPGRSPKKHTERDLEAGLSANVERFLQELGPDFSIGATQRQILVDGQYHTIDLELYHRGIPAIIIVERTVAPMKAQDVGQRISYVNWYAEHIPRATWEQLPVGLLICQCTGAEEARYQVQLPNEQELTALLRSCRQDSSVP